MVQLCWGLLLCTYGFWVWVGFINCDFELFVWQHVCLSACCAFSCVSFGRFSF